MDGFLVNERYITRGRRRTSASRTTLRSGPIGAARRGVWRSCVADVFALDEPQGSLLPDVRAADYWLATGHAQPCRAVVASEARCLLTMPPALLNPTSGRAFGTDEGFTEFHPNPVLKVICISASIHTPQPHNANLDATATARIKKPRNVRASAQTWWKHFHKVEGVQTFAHLAQTFAKVSVYADERIGEILRELPKGKGNQYTSASVTTATTPTKREAEKQANLDHHTAIDLQKLAANPEVVEAVIAKAEKDGRVVSRSQVLKAIKERDEARKVIGRSWGPIGDQKSKQARRLSV